MCLDTPEKFRGINKLATILDKTMKMRFIVLLVFLFIDLVGFAQDNIYDIELHFEHSLRIPNHYVDIKIQRRGDDVNLYVKVRPFKDSGEWAKNKIDSSFSISLDKFKFLIDELTKISCADIVSNSGETGLDGTICEIMFGDFGSSITYKVWAPDYDTNKRKLNDFLNVFKLILKTAGLKPNEIL